MNKKISKTKEQTEKRCDDKNKQPNEIDVLKKIKDRINKNRMETTQICRAPRVLHDRGDSKINKGDMKFKYDSSKINRATEVNAKTIKAETISNMKKYVNPIRKINELNQTICNNISNDDSKTKPIFRESLHTENRDVFDDKKVTEKTYSQKILARNDRIGNEKIKDSDQKKAKIKEVITIPYLPVDDSVTQITEDETDQIKPIIKTVTTKPSTKTLKTVTFKDQNLKVLPKNVEKKDIKVKPISSARTKIERNKTKIQPTMKTQRRKKRYSASPVKCVINEFPPTEVVKWEPSCLTSQTRPYYEAWVDTTLTAFSKYTEDEKLLLEKDLLKALQHLKRPVSPELIYERFKDERYTGKIRIRRR